MIATQSQTHTHLKRKAHAHRTRAPLSACQDARTPPMQSWFQIPAFDVLELESRTPGVQHATPPSLVCSGKTIFTPELLITLTPRVARRNLELPWWARLITFAIRRARLHTPRSFAPHVHTDRTHPFTPPCYNFFRFIRSRVAYRRPRLPALVCTLARVQRACCTIPTRKWLSGTPPARRYHATSMHISLPHYL